MAILICLLYALTRPPVAARFVFKCVHAPGIVFLIRVMRLSQSGGARDALVLIEFVNGRRLLVAVSTGPTKLN